MIFSTLGFNFSTRRLHSQSARAFGFYGIDTQEMMSEYGAVDSLVMMNQCDSDSVISVTVTLTTSSSPHMTAALFWWN